MLGICPYPRQKPQKPPKSQILAQNRQISPQKQPFLGHFWPFLAYFWPFFRSLDFHFFNLAPFFRSLLGPYSVAPLHEVQK